MQTVPISVVIPALNAERFIGEALASVQAQTLQVSEIIVVDNGCTDRTAQIAAEAGAIVVEEPTRGLSRSRNAGIRRATQEWIALLDSDDLWDITKIEQQWSAIQACPDAALVACYFRVFETKPATRQKTDPGVPGAAAALGWDGQGVLREPELLRTRVLPPDHNEVILEDSDDVQRQRWNGYRGKVIVNEHCRYFPKVEQDFFPRFLPSCSDALLRRDVFTTAGLFDENVPYNEDFEFFLRVLARFPLAIVEQTLISCRRHDQKHSFNLQGMRDSLFSVVNYMLQHPDNYPAGAPQVYRDALKKNFLTVERALQKRREADQKSTGAV